MTKAEREELTELQMRFETLASAVQVIAENAGEDRAASLIDAIRRPFTPQERARAQIADVLNERFGNIMRAKAPEAPARRCGPEEAKVVPLRRRAK
jgi:hypothetical protein